MQVQFCGTFLVLFPNSELDAHHSLPAVFVWKRAALTFCKISSFSFEELKVCFKSTDAYIGRHVDRGAIYTHCPIRSTSWAGCCLVGMLVGVLRRMRCVCLVEFTGGEWWRIPESMSEHE